MSSRVTSGRRGLVLGTLLAGLTGCASIGGGGDLGGSEPARSLGGAEQLVPGYVGQQMTPQDRERVRLALERNANYEPAAWQGGQRGTLFRVTPIRTFDGADGNRCRDYDTQATIDGRLQKIRATACRQADGSWRPLSD
jgi:surface antigen